VYDDLGSRYSQQGENAMRVRLARQPRKLMKKKQSGSHGWRAADVVTGSYLSATTVEAGTEDSDRYRCRNRKMRRMRRSWNYETNRQ
jgi:hypothetical protein